MVVAAIVVAAAAGTPMVVFCCLPPAAAAVLLADARRGEGAVVCAVRPYLDEIADLCFPVDLGGGVHEDDQLADRPL